MTSGSMSSWVDGFPGLEMGATHTSHFSIKLAVCQTWLILVGRPILCCSDKLHRAAYVMASDPEIRLVLDSMSAVSSSLTVKVSPSSSPWALPRSSAGFDRKLGLFLYSGPLEQVP